MSQAGPRSRPARPRLRSNYAQTLYLNLTASLDDVREAVTTLEDTERTARRVLGGAHPTTEGIELALENARGVLREVTA